MRMESFRVERKDPVHRMNWRMFTKRMRRRTLSQLLRLGLEGLALDQWPLLPMGRPAKTMLSWRNMSLTSR